MKAEVEIPRKVEVKVNFTDKAIERAANFAMDAILDTINDSVSGSIGNQLLEPDVVSSLCDNIQEQGDMSMNMIEIVFLQSRGSLFKQVRDKVLADLPDRIRQMAEDGTPNE